METRLKINKIPYLVIFFLLCTISSCTNLSGKGYSQVVTEIEPVNQNPNVMSDTQQISELKEPTIEPTATEYFTPTPDLRMKPEDWKNWPIIPTITNRSIEIFQIGKEKDVDPRAFSKIGDCQNVKESFMGIFDRSNYFLQDWQSDWQGTIDNFKGYFFRDGEAFGQGLNTAAALSPLHANPDNCLPNEGPVQCELRIVNPSIAFIRFERWYPDITPPEEYEKYLRQVIDLVIENGTVPILMTKADNIESGHQINQIIAKLAYEYDIPLYNWWRAAQSLPNRGMDSERNDGFHIDPDFGWTGQSMYGLGALDSIWKGLNEKE